MYTVRQIFRNIGILMLFAFVFVTNVKAADLPVYDYNFTGDYQVFVAPTTGIYKLETWGAAGGNNIINGSYIASTAFPGGAGAYASGEIYLKKGEILYVYVGGKGSDGIGYQVSAGGYNGGGNGDSDHNDDEAAGGGGGATDIRLVNGEWNNFNSLKSRIIVAGGGGGSAYSSKGGAGGTLIGGNTNCGKGGTQIDGYKFGIGQAGITIRPNYEVAGSGSGYYGGTTNPSCATDYVLASGGGGSSFVSGCSDCKAIAESSIEENIISTNQPNHYSNKVFNNIVMKSGTEQILNYDGTISTGNMNDGHARISFVKDLTPVTKLEIEGLTLNPTFAEGIFSYDVTLNTIIQETNITYEINDNIILVIGAGKVTLENGKPHSVIVMDDTGNITIYTINPNLGKAKLDTITFENIDYTFNPYTYEYEINVLNEINKLVPTITSHNGETYEIIGDTNLIVGKNIIKIKASKQGWEDTIYTYTITREFKSNSGQFKYTGDYQEFIAPNDGEYMLEVWGAQGSGNHESQYAGTAGKGGYSKGTITLKKGDKLYIYVGGKGSICSIKDCISPGGYNGGGTGNKLNVVANDPVSSGGGATDIRLVSGNWNSLEGLNSRIIVAGGGGGGGLDYEAAGAGGGLNGITTDGAGGTQTSGYAFGYGCSGNDPDAINTYGSSGGGGGWYGGGCKYYHGAGGGSGFIWNEQSKSNVPAGYSVLEKYYLTNATTIAGNTDMPTYDGKGTMTGNEGNGYAKITYMNAKDTDVITDISVDKGTLSPAFSSDNLNYTLELSPSDTELTITAKSKSNQILITGIGTVTVHSGINNFNVSVTNLDGSVEIYTIKANRTATDDVYLKGFKINGVEYTGFSENITDYEIVLPTNLEKINLELIKKYPDQSTTQNTIYDFTTEELIKNIIVVNESQTENKVYNFKFIREKSSALKELQIVGGMLDKKFDPNVLEYNLVMGHYDRSLDILATSYFSNAIITITGHQYIGLEDKLVTIKVDLEGVPSTIYQFNIVREPVVDKEESFTFEYTGDYQEFTVPTTGYYELEVWGAEGSGSHQHPELGIAGKGGYSKGIVKLTKGEKIYIYVGGQGNFCNTEKCTVLGGFNGGGNGYKNRVTALDPAASGGGATDIRFIKGDFSLPAGLNSRLIVAGGGGGGGMDHELGGSGGGLNGITTYGAGGTQTSGFAFGLGCQSNLTNADPVHGGPGGGGGWYGGGCKSYNGAGGGSGFIWNEQSKANVPSTYTVNELYYLTDAKTIDGNSLMPTHDGNGVMTGNEGNGYVKITSKIVEQGDPYLDSITLDKGNIALEFKPWITEYTIDLPNTKHEIKIEAVAKDEKSIVSGNGTFSLAPGQTTKDITVTTVDGTIKIYQVIMNREASSNSNPLDIKFKSDYTYLCRINQCTYTFNAETLNYNIVIPFSMTTIELETILTSPYQNVVYRKIVGSDKVEFTDKIIEVDQGVSTYEIEVTSEDGTNSTTYTYIITRDDTDNNNLANIVITNPNIAIEFNPKIFEYYITLPAIYSSFDVIATPQNNSATVKVMGNTNLVTGFNDCLITVTAPNGVVKTYILHVYKEQDSNTFLQSLDITNSKGNAIIYTPNFSKLLNNYSMVVESDIDKVNINAIAETGTVTGNGEYILNSGNNEILITVTSQIGTTNIYKINIFKNKSSNSNLDNIEVAGYTLTPNFSNEIKEYSLIVKNDVTSLNVIVTPQDSKTTYTIKGNNSLTNKSNTIVITSIAEDKSYQVYKINVTKESSTNNDLKDIVINNGTLNPTFDKNILNYQIEVEENISQITVNGILEDNKASIAGNGIYSLVKGTNTINLTITSEAGVAKIYTIVVTRKLNDDTTLKEIKTNQKSEVIKVDESNYLINVQYEINSIDINAIANSDTTTITGNGVYNLQTGENIIYISVTTEKGTTKVYNVKIVRDKSINDDLEYLFVKEGALYPRFDQTTIYYDVKVPNDVTKVTIDAITEDENATYEIINNELLEVGVAKDVIVRVTSPKGNTKDYTLHIIRQEATANNLSLLDIETNRGPLSPIFDPDTLLYTLEVENNIDSITLTATKLSDEVRIYGTGTHNLNVGKNPLSISVIGEDNVQKDYQIIVTRKKSNDATLANLVIKGSTLKPIFDKNTTIYEVNTSKTSLEFTTILPTESTAKVEIIGNQNFVSGSNEVIIRVTAPDLNTTKDYIIKVMKDSSENNNLSKLEVEGYNINPIFHKGVTLYALDVPNNLNAVVINATAEDSKATITGTGLHQIKAGSNYINITVTSEKGTTKTYTIVATKEKSDNNYLSKLSLDSGTLNPEFSKEQLIYNVDVPYYTSQITVSGILEDSSATTNSFKTYDLVEGLNTINITVISDSGIIRTYVLKVNRQKVNSAYLTDLTVQNYDLDSPFSKEIDEYFVNVNNETTSLTLHYETLDSGALVEVTGNENFVIGINTITIKVTASDKVTTNTYKIYVNRGFSTNNYLSSLTISNGDLNPQFTPEQMEYTVLVENNIEQITINATTQDISSTITTGTGNHLLNSGTNVIEIKVKSSIGVIRTYKINVIRRQSTNNYLKTLKVLNVKTTLPLTPTFDKTINEYNINVGSKIDFVEIMAETEDSKATILGNGIKQLVIGTNIIEVIVTSEDGNNNIYKIIINKEASTNNDLLSLNPSVGTLDPSFSSSILKYNLDLSAETTELSFTASSADDATKISGIENMPVKEGVSTRIITATAENGDVKTYTVEVMRATNSDAKLSSLIIENYPFEFNKDTFTYDIKVSASKKILYQSEITALANDSNATINYMGDLSLNEIDTNTYIIEVIAKDGYTTQEYKLNITRDNPIKSLMSDKYEINRKDAFDYVIGVKAETDLTNFINNFSNDSSNIKVYKETQLITSGLVGTGMIVKLEIDGIIYDELRIIIRGDLTGDGKINIQDKVRINTHITKTNMLEKWFFIAGDTTKDNLINIQDKVKLNNFITKNIDSLD